jgi:hypothetical protein
MSNRAKKRPKRCKMRRMTRAARKQRQAKDAITMMEQRSGVTRRTAERENRYIMIKEDER